MKLSISAARSGDTGISIQLEGEYDHITVFESGSDDDLPAACRKTQELLQDAIRKLDLLAVSAKPFHRATHDQINNS